MANYNKKMIQMNLGIWILNYTPSTMNESGHDFFNIVGERKINF